MRRHAVLVVLFSLLTCALGDRSRIMETCGLVADLPDDESGSLTYYFPTEGFIPNTDPGSPGTIDCDAGEMSRCNQSVNPNALQGRTWYMTQDKAYFGQGYNPWQLQLFNIQCPLYHYLNLAPVGGLQLVCGAAGLDTLRVITSRGDTGNLCEQGDLESSYLYNEGRGIFLKDGNARIEFCSDGSGMDYGFVLRATCIDPILSYNTPGCASFQFFRDWDPEFVDRIIGPFENITRIFVPHKRSAEESANTLAAVKQRLEELTSTSEDDKQLKEDAVAAIENNRFKRGVRYYFNITEGTTVTYINNDLVFVFPNGTRRTFIVYCLVAYNDLYGTRTYTRNATRQAGDTTGATTITFTGPGYVDITTTEDRSSRNALLLWTPPEPFETFLENDGLEQQLIAKSIYEYIVEQWGDAYPVIDTLISNIFDPPAFPLRGPDDKNFRNTVRTRNEVGIVFPRIIPDSVCEAVVREDVAPIRKSRIDPDILYFCSFFQFACDPVLKTACREIMYLDPFDNDPLARAMMMMPGAD